MKDTRSGKRDAALVDSISVCFMMLRYLAFDAVREPKLADAATEYATTLNC